MLLGPLEAPEDDPGIASQRSSHLPRLNIFLTQDDSGLFWNLEKIGMKCLRCVDNCRSAMQPAFCNFSELVWLLIVSNNASHPLFVTNSFFNLKHVSYLMGFALTHFFWFMVRLITAQRRWTWTSSNSRVVSNKSIKSLIIDLLYRRSFFLSLPTESQFRYITVSSVPVLQIVRRSIAAYFLVVASNMGWQKISVNVT